MNMTVKIFRPTVVLARGNKILVLKSKYSSGVFYLLPGGNVEAMETVIETAVREVKEETNYDIRIGRLLYLYEWIDTARDRNVLYIVFLGHITGGDETYIKDPCAGNGHIQAIEWKTIDELKSTVFHPKSVLSQIAKGLKNNFKSSGVYLIA